MKRILPLTGLVLCSSLHSNYLIADKLDSNNNSESILKSGNRAYVFLSDPTIENSVKIEQPYNTLDEYKYSDTSRINHRKQQTTDPVQSIENIIENLFKEDILDNKNRFQEDNTVSFYTGDTNDFLEDIFNVIIKRRVSFMDENLLYIKPSVDSDLSIDSLDIYLLKKGNIGRIDFELRVGYDTNFSRLQGRGAMYLSISLE